MATPPQGEYLVIDIDPRSAGEESFTHLLETLGELPPTVTARTGGGGRHLWYRVPADTVPGKQLAPGVDLRGCGRSYVVLPPSGHTSGAFYEWLRDPQDEAIATLPPAWLSAVLGQQDTKYPKKPPIPKAIHEGEGRNVALARLLGGLRRLGMEEDELIEYAKIFNTGRCLPPLEEREVLSTAHSIARYPAGDPIPVTSIEDPEEEHWPTASEFLRDDPTDLIRLETGLETLDRSTRGGIPTGIVTAIQGPPHTGKTAIASQLALIAAALGWTVVCLFKDEGRRAATIRIGQQLGGIRENLEAKKPEAIETFIEREATAPILTPDPDSIKNSLEKALARFERLAGGGPRLFMVDSIQSAYAECCEEARSEREAINLKMRLLEGAAKRGALVIVISEVNRSSYRHKDPEQNIVGLAAGAESRAIEYVSRLLVGLDGDIEKSGVKASIYKNSPGGKRPFFYLKLNPESARVRQVEEEEIEADKEAAREARAGFEDAGIRAGILKTVQNHSGATSGEIKAEVKGRAEDVIRVRNEMVEEGILRIEEYKTQGGTKKVFVQAE